MTKVEIDLGTLTNSCFIIMPFSPTYETEYERIIRPAVEEAGLGCKRADAIYSKPQITADIWKYLRSARFVIAELTGKNSNVLYEVGLAHAIGKPAIIITRNEEDVPFDLKALRYRYYNIDDPFWGENLKKALTDMLKSLVNENEYGTVFEKITTVGEIEYKKERLPRKEEEKSEKPLHDLTGVWQGIWKTESNTYNCNLHLIQNNHDLSGTMIVSYIKKSQLTVVQEIMIGEIKRNDVNLYGVSYSYLQQGVSAFYILDKFSVKINPEGNGLSGFSTDDLTGTKAALTITRLPLDINKES